MMLKRILDRLFGRRRAPASADVERFGDFAVERKIGWTILEGTRKRRAMRLSIRDRLSTLSDREKFELVDRPLLRFALWTVDLPASESNHHADPFGLLDHSIDVAQRTAGELAKPNFRISSDPGQNHFHRPAVVYAGFAAALVHDAGKATNVEIKTASGERWNPHMEPLASHRLRNNLPLVGGGVRFVRGRGERAHEARAQSFLPQILTPFAIQYAGPWLGLVLDAYFDRSERRQGLPEPARRVAEIIKVVDKSTSRKDYHTRRGRQEEAKVNRARKEDRTGPAVGSGAPTDAEEVLRRGAAPSDYVLNAIRIALEQDLLPRNGYSARLFTGKRYLFVVYPEGLTHIAGIMKRRWGGEDGRVDELVSKDSSAYALASELARHGFLFKDATDRLWKFAARINHPTGEVETEDALLVPLEHLHLKSEPEPFQGTIELASHLSDRRVIVGDLDGDSAKDDGSRGDIEEKPPASPSEDGPHLHEPSPKPPGPQAAAAAEAAGGGEKPVRRPVLRSSKSEGGSPGEGGLDRRTLLELDPARLIRTMREALRSGRLRRNSYRAGVYIREDYTWFVFPDAFRAIAEEDWRVPYEKALGKRILDSLAEHPQVDKKSKRKVCFHAKLHSAAGGPKCVVRILTKGFLTREDLACLGTYHEPITIVDGDAGSRQHPGHPPPGRMSA